MANEPVATAAGWYRKMMPKRESYLRRARDAAELSIPPLIPREGHNSTNDLPTPWQGLGERGVRNLASKLLLILCPRTSRYST